MDHHGRDQLIAIRCHATELIPSDVVVISCCGTNTTPATVAKAFMPKSPEYHIVYNLLNMPATFIQIKCKE
jgi:hypothetical protein